jgi:hypothetical protein
VIKISFGRVWMSEQIQTAGGAAASPHSTQRGTKVSSWASSALAKYSPRTTKKPQHQGLRA